MTKCAYCEDCGRVCERLLSIHPQKGSATLTDCSAQEQFFEFAISDGSSRSSATNFHSDSEV